MGRSECDHKFNSTQDIPYRIRAFDGTGASMLSWNGRSFLRILLLFVCTQFVQSLVPFGIKSGYRGSSRSLSGMCWLLHMFASAMPGNQNEKRVDWTGLSSALPMGISNINRISCKHLQTLRDGEGWLAGCFLGPWRCRRHARTTHSKQFAVFRRKTKARSSTTGCGAGPLRRRFHLDS